MAFFKTKAKIMSSKSWLYPSEIGIYDFYAYAYIHCYAYLSVLKFYGRGDMCLCLEDFDGIFQKKK